MIHDTLDPVNKLQAALYLAQVFASVLARNTPFQKFEQRYFSILDKNYKIISYQLLSYRTEVKLIIFYKNCQATQKCLTT